MQPFIRISALLFLAVCLSFQTSIFAAGDGYTIGVNESVNFKDNSQGAASWAWNFGDGSGTYYSKDISHSFDSPGTYLVTLTITNGSCNKVVSKEVYVLPATPIEEMKAFTQGIEVFPNPANERINLQINNEFVGDITVDILSADGKTIATHNQSKSFSAFEQEFDIEKLSTGMYFLKLKSGAFEKTVKFIKN